MNPSRRKLSTWYELLVAEMHRTFDATALVLHNRKIVGKSGRQRQIDVSIQKNVGGSEVFILVECKYHGKPIEIGMVDALIGKMDDVGASRGVLVSDSGFQEGALDRAKSSGKVDVLSIVDNAIPDLRSRITCAIRVCYYQYSLPFDATFKKFGGEKDSWSEIRKEHIETLVVDFLQWSGAQIYSLPAGTHTYNQTLGLTGGVSIQGIFKFEKTARCFDVDILADAKGIYDHAKKKLINGQWSYTYEVIEEVVVRDGRQVPLDSPGDGVTSSIARHRSFNLEKAGEWADEFFKKFHTN